MNNQQVRDFIADVFKRNDEYSLTQEFEEKFCEKFGVDYSVAINSATSGLHAALAAAVATFCYCYYGCVCNTLFGCDSCVC